MHSNIMPTVRVDAFPNWRGDEKGCPVAPGLHSCILTTKDIAHQSLCGPQRVNQNRRSKVCPVYVTKRRQDIRQCQHAPRNNKMTRVTATVYHFYYFRTLIFLLPFSKFLITSWCDRRPFGQVPTPPSVHRLVSLLHARGPASRGISR